MDDCHGLVLGLGDDWKIVEVDLLRLLDLLVIPLSVDDALLPHWVLEVHREVFFCCVHACPELFLALHFSDFVLCRLVLF